MLQIKNVTLYRGQKCLLDNASVMINAGEKVGIVGSNGVGKSSLFKLIQGQLEIDKGEYSKPNGLRIAEIRQEIPHSKQSAMAYVLSGDLALANVLDTLYQAEQEGDGMKIADCHHSLAEMDGYTAESRAAKILVGLGFTDAELRHSVDSFSGGWRMRLNLAQVLMIPSDLLLLDEPTNHLDLEAIFWLERWLDDMKTTLLVISHDRDFLDHVAKRIIFVKDQQLSVYGGNYSRFEEAYAMQLSQQNATYDKQQRKIAHLTGFIDRFRYTASKAKQAQSRLKMLERMDKVAPVHMSNPFSFEFKQAPAAGNPMITLRQASIGYGKQPILTNVSLSIHPGDRLAFIGPNGAGKSTLIKALAQQLPVEGDSLFNSKLRIGYFTQHQVDTLKLNQNSLWHLQHLDSKIGEREARQFLGGFDFSDDRVFEPVQQFSGGEKARLALALLVWQQPNLLLLDEPSNHLDMEMRQALMTALQNYDGALILIAHDRYLLTSLINDFHLVADGTVQKFAGDLDDYEEWVSNRQKGNKAAKNTPIVEPKPVSVDNTHWQKQFEKKERELNHQQALLREIDAQLIEVTLYQDPARLSELQAYQQKQKALQDKILHLEDEILQIMENL